MRPALHLALWLGLSVGLEADTIRVTDLAGVTLQTRDELRFEFTAWNYGRYVSHGLPDRIAFQFTTAPLDTAAAAVLDAVLESADGLTTVSFGDSIFLAPGIMKASKYRGAVSVWSGSTTLTGEESAGLFGEKGQDPTVLVLRNQGDAVTLGLTGYSTGQEMLVSVSGQGLSVGAVRGQVYLQSAPPTFWTASYSLSEEGSGTMGVPEPETARLVLGALAAAALFGRRAWPKGA